MIAGLTVEDILFHSFAIVAVISALCVIFVRNPVYSALFLALCMSVLGAMYFTLQAYFVSVAQITVYAGAVMVLFVMVVMLFDLKRETEEILKFSPVTLAKILSAALLCGFLVGTGWLGVTALTGNPATQIIPGVTAGELTKGELSKGGLTKVKAVETDAELKATPEEARALMNKLSDISGASSGGTANPDEDLSGAEAAKLVDSAPSDNGPKISADENEFGSTVALSKILFSKFVFAFEAVSLLLLVAIVGAVALAKSKGGTHHVA